MPLQARIAFSVRAESSQGNQVGVQAMGPLVIQPLLIYIYIYICIYIYIYIYICGTPPPPPQYLGLFLFPTSDKLPLGGFKVSG